MLLWIYTIGVLISIPYISFRRWQMKKKIAISVAIAITLTALVIIGGKKIRARVEIVDADEADE